MSTPFNLGDTVHYFDAFWGPKKRMGVVIGDNGDGTLAIARTTTVQARKHQQPLNGGRRLSPDGLGQGNSLNEVCDLLTSPQTQLHRMPLAAIIPDPTNGDLVRGHLGKADGWWLEDQLLG